MGYPVVGDEQHGAEGNPIGRIALHASALELLHPETDEPVRFDATIPFGPE
jgi:23S rRNA pseudouridine1911/1915/1917 synthase